MKRCLILIIAVLSIASQAVPVKLTHKLLKEGAKAYSCELLTGNVNYKLAFKITEKGEHKFISGIGLLAGKQRYSKRGWASSFSGFFKLTAKGLDLTKMPVNFATDENGIVFDFKAVKIIFKARDNDDKLGMNIVFSKAPQNGTIQFICYPGNFFRNEPEKRKRITYTAKRLIPSIDSKRNVNLNADEYWLYYMDKKFDPGEKGPYFSTCALVYNPREVDSASLQPGTYAIKTDVKLSSKVRNFSFVLWEFPGRKSENCLKSMQELSINFK
jgi:hypothetical protein